MKRILVFLLYLLFYSISCIPEQDKEDNYTKDLPLALDYR